MTPAAVTPILRIFDEAMAKQFYLDYLEFTLDWEHRFEAGSPLYMQVSKGNVLLHLSMHYGDCSPGAAVRIETDELVPFRMKLIDKRNVHSRPGIEETPWGTREMTLTDPFGNRLIWYEREE